MVALASVYYLEGTDHYKIGVSEEKLRALFQQIETELLRSATFQNVLQQLQDDEQVSSNSVQTLLKTIGREAIRLALRQLVRQFRVLPPTSPASSISAKRMQSVSVESQPEDTLVHLNPNPLPVAHQPTELVKESVEESFFHDSPSAPAAEVVPARSHALKPKPKTDAELQREAMLQHIGRSLQQARHARQLSLEQLHQQTWIPIYQLKALEAGDAARLPEDIYIQGFVKRIITTLKWDDPELAYVLNQSTSSKSVIPSWHHEPETGLQPWHLYVSYAALMVGAVGGLAWVSHQQAVGEFFDSALPYLIPSQTADSPSSETLQVRPGLSLDQSAIANPDVLPPEGLSNQY